jgi:hypothetical protein
MIFDLLEEVMGCEDGEKFQLLVEGSLKLLVRSFGNVECLILSVKLSATRDYLGILLMLSDALSESKCRSIEVPKQRSCAVVPAPFRVRAWAGVSSKF